MAKDTETAKGNGTPPPAIGDNSTLTEADFLALVHKHASATAKLKAAQSERKALRKQMRAAGVVLGDFDAAVRMTEWPREEVTETFENRVQYLRWLRVPIGFQFDLFEALDADAQDDDERLAALVAGAETEGWQKAVLGGAEADNPHEANAPAGQAWIKGFRDGASFVAKQRQTIN